ncbi:HAD family phosphatase [Kocuria coralli]|uniref:HAD family phosphatase n=1 Tax=Kocuria coralli TaxID=1461025 RepID=A0A5J5KZT4_9MICC|nr:HAD family hydrolase [Kocuria coralli]KAA9394221.1 HAD family phosphatase [Kocuria coralli]
MVRDVRLVASDLDGTLIGHDFRFRPRTLEALAALEDSGVPVVFVTGRPSRWLHPLREQIAPAVAAVGTVICSNGAMVYDLATDEVVSASTFEGHIALSVVERLRERVPGVYFSAETLRGVVAEPGWIPTDRTGMQDVEVGVIESVLTPDDAVVKFLAKHDGRKPHAFIREVTRLAAEQVTVTHSVPAVCLAEMSRLGLSKAHTLKAVCGELGVDRSQVMAFGDMPNDLEMLTWARYGFAMASGSPAVVDAVERTAPAFEEDGVAQVVEAFLAARPGPGLAR